MQIFVTICLRGSNNSKKTPSWASYQIRKIAGCACAGNAGNVSPRRQFQRKPLVSDPGMHHGTCVTHVPWCMSGSLTCDEGGNVPGIPGACAPAILRIWQDAHGLPVYYSISQKMTGFIANDMTCFDLTDYISLFIFITLCILRYYVFGDSPVFEWIKMSCDRVMIGISCKVISRYLTDFSELCMLGFTRNAWQKPCHFPVHLIDITNVFGLARGLPSFRPLIGSFWRLSWWDEFPANVTLSRAFRRWFVTQSPYTFNGSTDIFKQQYF